MIKVGSGLHEVSNAEFEVQLCDANKCVSATNTFKPTKHDGEYTVKFTPTGAFTPTELVISSTSTDGACFASVTYKGEVFSMADRSYCGGLDVDSPKQGQK